MATWQQKYAISTTCIIFCRIKIVLYICILKQFCQDFENLLQHDKETFDKPEGWTEKHLGQSPLLVDFPTIWSELKNTYVRELLV